jgi:hypothetical protein
MAQRERAGKSAKGMEQTLLMELKKMPYPSWQVKFDSLMRDPYLAKKYNRIKRIKDKRKYMTAMTPEIKVAKGHGKLILDIGPGPGEWLEICREFGHRVIGIDAQINDCEMGNEYIQLSQLMTHRQNLNVFYIGFERFLLGVIDENRPSPFVGIPAIYPESVFYINSQGSIEQCFKDYMSGTPHRITKNAAGLSWVVDKKLKDMFYKMFAEFERILEDGGYIFIWANGSTNNAAYNKLIHETLDKFSSLELYANPNKRIHKIRKCV